MAVFLYLKSANSFFKLQKKPNNLSKFVKCSVFSIDNIKTNILALELEQKSSER